MIEICDTSSAIGSGSGLRVWTRTVQQGTYCVICNSKTQHVLGGPQVSDLVYVFLGHLNEKHVARHIAYNRAIKEERIRHSVQNIGGFFPWQFGYKYSNTRLSLNSQQALTLLATSNWLNGANVKGVPFSVSISRLSLVRSLSPTKDQFCLAIAPDSQHSNNVDFSSGE